jgi:hypothetical protein
VTSCDGRRDRFGYSSRDRRLSRASVQPGGEGPGGRSITSQGGLAWGQRPEALCGAVG